MTEGAPQTQLTERQIRDIVKNTEDTTKQEPHEMPKEKKFGDSFKRKIAAGVAAFTIATGVGATATGCEQIPTAVVETQPSETDPSVTTSENGTSVKVDPVVVTETTETTTAPTETTVETTTPTETEVNAELAEAPEIAGLSKEIEDGKVVYKAVEGNAYGIEAGEFAGEYNANVSVEGSRVGGVILEPEVITQIIGDKSEIIPPLDITGVTAETGLNIVDTTDLAAVEMMGKKFQTILIEFNGQLEFINPFVKDNQFNTTDEFVYNMTYKKEDETTVDFKNQAGLTPFSTINAPTDGSGTNGMGDYYYVFDVENTDKINNFNEDKTYKKGEKTGVMVDSYLAVYCGFYNIDQTTTENLARTDEGAVIFTYPQEKVEEGK